MKADRILDALGKVKEDYIMESAPNMKQPRTSNIRTRVYRYQNTQKRTVPFRRTLLIAAILAALLLLAGYAAVKLVLNDLVIGTFLYNGTNGETKSGDFISLQGYIDSDNYKAAQEWNQYLDQYDPDGSLLKEAEENGFVPPIDYMAYLCYTPDMVKQIDAICRKYNLELLGPTYGPTYPTSASSEILAPLGIESITASGTGVGVDLSNGYYYRDGSFALEGNLDFSDSDDLMPGSVAFQYRCVMKTSFDGVALGIGNAKSYDQWNYSGADGTEVLLALSDNKALIIADKETLFISINILAQHMTKAGLEAAADAFIFNYSPQQPDPGSLVEPEWYPGVNKAEEQVTYLDYFLNWLPGSVGSEAYSPDYQQKFVDLDVDGIDEMLIWNARTGIIYEVVTQVNGELICVYGSGTYAKDDHTVSVYLCEGNILEKDCKNLQGKQLKEYYRLQDHQLVMVESLMESTDGKFYWSESGGASSLMWKEISAAECDTIQNKYIRLGATNPQLSDAVPDIQETEEAVLLQVLKNQALFYSVSYDESCTLAEYCTSEEEFLGIAVTITQYTFVDMDNDGIQEAVVDFRFGENSQVMCMVLKWDSSSETVSGTEFYYRQMYQIKEDGTFSYSGGAFNNGTARIKFTESGWEYVILGGTEELNGQVSFFWDGQSVSQDEYEANIEGQNAKKSVVWVTYPSDAYTISFPGLK